MNSHPSTFPPTPRHAYHVHQEPKLRRHLSGTSGTDGCEASSFGAQLERLATMGAGAAPCRRCGGKPKQDLPGSGVVVAPRYRARHRAYLEQERKAWAAVGQKPPKGASPPWAWCDACPQCKGMGWVIRQRRRRGHGPVTVNPTGSSKHGILASGIPVHGCEMTGRMGSWLAELRHDHPREADAVETYYGPGGGSLSALLPLVGPGPSRHRDARDLLSRACELWDALVPDESDDPRRTREQEIARDFWREVS